jgi:rhamnose utilization protein RhaD (predicted bifunctional aldolase and dehydrogenase)
MAEKEEQCGTLSSMDDMDALKILSARAGSDPLLVQAAGGNTSLKDGGVMRIKASGTWLRDALTRDIFVPVDHGALIKALADNDPRCESCVDFVRGDLNASGLRPSIETTVHALMPQRIVVHVHCVNTIAWAIREDAEAALRRRLADFNWAFIPYARPGLPLARAIASRLDTGINVLVLGNHGLVVAADTVREAEALLEAVVTAVKRPSRDAPEADLATLERMARGTSYGVAKDREAHALATDELALARGAHAVFYPDHVVFLGTDVATSLEEEAPLVAVPGKGVLIREDAKPAIEPMGRCLADVMRRVEAGDRLVALTAEDIDQLVNWDAEKYRQSLTQSGNG